jgi:hypothetical protein
LHSMTHQSVPPARPPIRWRTMDWDSRISLVIVGVVTVVSAAMVAWPAARPPGTGIIHILAFYVICRIVVMAWRWPRKSWLQPVWWQRGFAVLLLVGWAWNVADFVGIDLGAAAWRYPLAALAGYGAAWGIYTWWFRRTWARRGREVRAWALDYLAATDRCKCVVRRPDDETDPGLLSPCPVHGWQGATS